MFLTGSQLRAARALAGLSRSQLAAATGVSVSALGCWERSSNGVIFGQGQQPAARRRRAGGDGHPFRA